MVSDSMKGCLTTGIISVIFGTGMMVSGALYLVYRGDQAIEKYLNEPVITIEQKDIIGDKTSDEFIMYNGKPFLRKIDGKSIEDILKE